MPSGPWVQPIVLDRATFAVVWLRDAQHVYELTAEPSRHDQRRDRHD
jgi:hypothetical protein